MQKIAFVIAHSGESQHQFCRRCLAVAVPEVENEVTTCRQCRSTEHFCPDPIAIHIVEALLQSVRSRSALCRFFGAIFDLNNNCVRRGTDAVQEVMSLDPQLNAAVAELLLYGSGRIEDEHRRMVPIGPSTTSYVYFLDFEYRFKHYNPYSMYTVHVFTTDGRRVNLTDGRYMRYLKDTHGVLEGAMEVDGGPDEPHDPAPEIVLPILEASQPVCDPNQSAAGADTSIPSSVVNEAARWNRATGPLCGTNPPAGSPAASSAQAQTILPPFPQGSAAAASSDPKDRKSTRLNSSHT